MLAVKHDRHIMVLQERELPSAPEGFGKYFCLLDQKCTGTDTEAISIAFLAAHDDVRTLLKVQVHYNYFLPDEQAGGMEDNRVWDLAVLATLDARDKDARRQRRKFSAKFRS